MISPDFLRSGPITRLLLLACVLGLTAGVVASCGHTQTTTPTGPAASSPTEAYKLLYAAVKSKDTEAIKATMSKKTQEFAVMVSQKQSSPIEKVFENGFTATTFAESLPEIRDERVVDDMGNLEVFNSKDNRWEDLPFILENGNWRLAVGDLFAGTHKSAGKGRAQKEAEAANVLSNNMVPVNANVNINAASNVPNPAAVR